MPIALALLAENVLSVTFLAKSLRAALAVLIVLMFYRPGYGSSRGALVSIVAALVATTGWFLAGDPVGVDNAYIAVATPLVIMTGVHLLRRRKASPARSPAAAREGT